MTTRKEFDKRICTMEWGTPQSGYKPIFDEVFVRLFGGTPTRGGDVNGDVISPELIRLLKKDGDFEGCNISLDSKGRGRSITGQHGDVIEVKIGPRLSNGTLSVDQIRLWSNAGIYAIFTAYKEKGVANLFLFTKREMLKLCHQMGSKSHSIGDAALPKWYAPISMHPKYERWVKAFGAPYSRGERYLRHMLSK